MLLGLHGPSHSGKDTIARALVTQYGYQHFAFADFLKDALAAFFGMPRDDFNESPRKEEINPYWGFSPRQLMLLGGKAWRDTLGNDIYIKRMALVLRQFPPNANIVISDVRLATEASFVRTYPGRLIHVMRGAEATSGSEEETERRLPFEAQDLVLINAGSLQDLALEIKQIISQEIGVAHIDSGHS